MKRITLASLVIMCLLAVCTFDDLLSLHDIKADYVSASVFRHLGIPFPEALPPGQPPVWNGHPSRSATSSEPF
jgi:hypothetical protein